MLTKGKRIIEYAQRKKKAKRGLSFFELAKRHMFRSKDTRDRTLSKDIDKILYGVN